MPIPQRRVLGEIAGNRGKGKELTPYIRGKIKGFAEGGLVYSEIVKKIRKPIGTIVITLRRDKVRKQGKNQPRPGQPVVTTARDRRRILYAVKKDPRISYAKIRS